MATKKKSARKRKAVRKNKAVRKSVRKKARKKSTVASLKARIRKAADERLKQGLFRRDKATTRKAHLAAQRAIDAARSELRKYS